MKVSILHFSYIVLHTSYDFLFKYKVTKSIDCILTQMYEHLNMQFQRIKILPIYINNIHLVYYSEFRISCVVNDFLPRNTGMNNPNY